MGRSFILQMNYRNRVMSFSWWFCWLEHMKEQLRLVFIFLRNLFLY